MTVQSSSRITAPLLLTVGLLSAAAPFATDLYLPAFPQMVEDLATSATGVQLSLTAFLVGAGLGQAIFGPLSDRWGRRQLLIGGTAIYVIAGIGAALAPTVALLVAARLLQGLSGAAGMVLGRAVISDLARGQDAARAFSLMMLIGGIAPVLAPVVGSLLVAPLGWRGLLWIVAGISLVALIAAVAFVPETAPGRSEMASARSGLGSLANRRFAGNAVAFAFAFATMMAYISASPFLYQDMMGMSEVQYGLVFAVNALALAAASGLSARLASRYSPVLLARIGLLVNLGAIVSLAILVVAGAAPLWFAVPILVAVSALGLVLGNTTALALGQVPESAGLGSAALGLLQFLLAGVVASLVSLGASPSAVPLAVTMLVASVVANGAFVVAGRSAALS